MVMLKYVPLQRGTDAACMPKEALGDIACANIAMHMELITTVWYEYKHEHEWLTA